MRLSILLCSVIIAGSDFYRVLGVPRDASHRDIDSAYHDRMQATASVRWRACAHVVRQRLRAAIATLGDARSRRAYDAHLALFGPDRPPFPM